MSEPSEELSLELLLGELNRGDVAAAEQVFREYEPYLRLLVRRRGEFQGERDAEDALDFGVVVILN